MTHKTLVIDLDRCIGCFACEMACKQENNGPLGVHYNKVLSIGPMGKFPDLTQYFLPTVCQHCKDAPCVKVCPTGATYQTEDGQVLVNKEKCIGCKMCANACPYDVPVFNTEGRTSYFGDKQPLVVRPAKPHTERTPGKAEHCTLCTHRLAEGRLPACVENCSTKALTLVDYDSKDPEVQALIKRSICLSEEAGTQPKVRYICSNMDFKSVKLK